MSKEDFPALECPICGVLRNPRSHNKDGSVTYSCPPDYRTHAKRLKWRIDVDGSLMEWQGRWVLV